MRQLIVKIDAGATTCDDCKNKSTHALIPAFCLQFNRVELESSTVIEDDGTMTVTHVRLHECLEAERTANEYHPEGS